MKRIVVGITGASGVIYGIRLLEVLKDTDIETHLILSDPAKKNIEIETDWAVSDVMALAHACHDNHDMTAPVASGSFLTSGMIVVPCTIKSLSAIVHSYNETLITRASDVTLKENRKLTLVVRETPLHKGHLKMMMEAADLGAQILPPMPAFYHRPETLEDIVDQTVGKILDSLMIPHQLFRRWGGGRTDNDGKSTRRSLSSQAIKSNNNCCH